MAHARYARFPHALSAEDEHDDEHGRAQLAPVRVRSAAAGKPDRMSIALCLGLPAAPASLAAIRTAAASVAYECGLERRGIEDVRLAVSEAATQIMLDGTAHEVRIEATAVDGELAMLVTGEPPGRPTPGVPARRGLPRAAERQLGLPIIAALASRVEVVRGAAGARVRMTFAYPATAPAVLSRPPAGSR